MAHHLDVDSGLGDRFYTYMVMMVIGMQIGFTPIYDHRVWSLDSSRNGNHGNYSDTEEFFRFSRTLLDIAGHEQLYPNMSQQVLQVSCD